MYLWRCRQPALAWVAILALLAMALLPTVTHAMTHLRGNSSPWVEVCTPQGMRWVSLADGEDGPANTVPLQAAAHLEHCPLCTLSQPLPALPPADLPRAWVPLAAPPVPGSLPHVADTLPDWGSAQPRGPPARLA